MRVYYLDDDDAPSIGTGVECAYCPHVVSTVDDSYTELDTGVREYTCPACGFLFRLYSPEWLEGR